MWAAGSSSTCPRRAAASAWVSGSLVRYAPPIPTLILAANKIAAYREQEKGADTVEANRRLGLPDDARTYDHVKLMLDDMGVHSVQLLTNNPRKIHLLQELGMAPMQSNDDVTLLTIPGIQVTARVPVIVAPNPFNLNYLATKHEKMGHLLEDDQPQSL